MYSTKDICKDVSKTTSKLNKMFDTAFEINNSGNGTDLSRMVTDSTPAILQLLGFFTGQIENIGLTEFLQDCLNVRKNTRKLEITNELKSSNAVTDEEMFNICIPFRDKYNLSDIQAFSVAKNNLPLFQLFSMWDEVKMDLLKSLDKLNNGEENSIKRKQTVYIGSTCSMSYDELINTSERLATEHNTDYIIQPVKGTDLTPDYYISYELVDWEELK